MLPTGPVAAVQLDLESATKKCQLVFNIYPLVNVDKKTMENNPF